MTDFHGFRGTAKRLSDIDLPRIGHRIGVGEDEIHAFMDVEAAGSGFDSAGRPKMLFEPHVFWRNLPPEQRVAAERAGLAYPDWRPGTYPAQSYTRLESAIAINETAALRASSWGLSQILGENHKRCGYNTAQEMVLDFMESEANQLEATITLLIQMGIDDDLRAHRWAVVARYWNGSGYAKNRYDIKLQEAFSKWSKIRNTPWTPDADEDRGITVPAGTRLLKLTIPHMTGIDVQIWQRNLIAVGFPVGRAGADGDFGSDTDKATRAFQKSRSIVADGKVGSATRLAMSMALSGNTPPFSAPKPATVTAIGAGGAGAEKGGAYSAPAGAAIGRVAEALRENIAQQRLPTDIASSSNKEFTGMDGFKSALASKAVWGGILSVVAAGLATYGYSVSVADQAAIADLITMGVSLVGGILAIYGRVKATKVIAPDRETAKEKVRAATSRTGILGLVGAAALALWILSPGQARADMECGPTDKIHVALAVKWDEWPQMFWTVDPDMVVSVWYGEKVKGQPTFTMTLDSRNGTSCVIAAGVGKDLEVPEAARQRLRDLVDKATNAKRT